MTKTYLLIDLQSRQPSPESVTKGKRVERVEVLVNF
jgi:hypothetical protein